MIAAAESEANVAFGALGRLLAKQGASVQQKVAAHVRAVTGRPVPLPVYHNDASIGESDKLALYRQIAKAVISHDYSELKGQVGEGAKRVDPLDVPVEAKPKAKPEAKPEEKPKPVVVVATQDGYVERPARPKDMGHDLSAAIAAAISPLLDRQAPKLDEGRVGEIAKEFAADVVSRALTDYEAGFASRLKHELGNGGFPVNRVKQLIDEAMGDFKRVALVFPDGSLKEIEGATHESFGTLAKMAATRVNVLITGPTGSGKTHAAEQVAKSLGLPFYYNGAIDTEYKLKGFIDAGGKLISPAFRKAWENGGVYLFDEVDASLPPAVLSFNGALSNDLCDFPDGMVKRHKDCIILATANTWLGGATFDYVGRMKQDAAFADRFATLYWGVDEKLERTLCSNAPWVKYVQAARANVVRHGMKVIISPRATVNGAKLLAAGIPLDDVVKATVRKGMTDDQWKLVNPEVQS